MKECQNSEIYALGFYLVICFGICVHFLRLYEFLENRAPVQTQAPETMFVGYQMVYTSNKQQSCLRDTPHGGGPSSKLYIYIYIYIYVVVWDSCARWYIIINTATSNEHGRASIIMLAMCGRYRYSAHHFSRVALSATLHMLHVSIVVHYSPELQSPLAEYNCTKGHSVWSSYLI